MTSLFLRKKFVLKLSASGKKVTQKMHEISKSYSKKFAVFSLSQKCQMIQKMWSLLTDNAKNQCPLSAIYTMEEDVAAALCCLQNLVIYIPTKWLE
jgi:hypothetical protein